MSAINPLLGKLGIRLPILQAPMAGVSSPAMAAAVGAAGGLGALGVGAAGADSARSMIRSVRDRWTGPLNVNVFAHRPAIADAGVEAAWIERFRSEFEALDSSPPAQLNEIYTSFVEDDAMLAMLIEEKPSVVSFHFGLPSDTAIRALKAAGITLLATATSLAEARLIAAAGFDAVIAQGWEAGGHRGVFDADAPDARLDLATLTRLLVRTMSLPVIAAGGLMDGADIAAALSLGASAAQLGTAFVATDESLADDGYRAAVLRAVPHMTVMTRMISGRPARGLANHFSVNGAKITAQDIPDYPIAYALGKALNAAAKAKGLTGFGAHWAGQGVSKIRAMSAGRLVENLAAELARSLR